jgi:hypothetical protein
MRACRQRTLAAIARRSQPQSTRKGRHFSSHGASERVSCPLRPLDRLEHVTPNLVRPEQAAMPAAAPSSI